MDDSASQPTRLQIVTPPHPEPEAITLPGSSSCPHDYDGWCDDCVAERARRVKHGVRPRRPIPTRHAA